MKAKGLFHFHSLRSYLIIKHYCQLRVMPDPRMCDHVVFRSIFDKAKDFLAVCSHFFLQYFGCQTTLYDLCSAIQPITKRKDELLLSNSSWVRYTCILGNTLGKGNNLSFLTTMS